MDAGCSGVCILPGLCYDRAMRYLHLQGLPGPIAFEPETAAIADMLKSVLAGWPEGPDDGPAGEKPFLFVTPSAQGPRVERPKYRFSRREPTDVSAVCTLIVELVDAYISAAPHLGSLHAASAEFAGRLVLFPATHRVGKSTLMTRLAASGRRIFSDDLVPIDLAAGEAVATGCLPRLRLPLPASASPAFASYVKSNAVLDDGYYCYVAPVSPTLHGDRSTIGAVVLLERRESGGAEILEAPVEDALLKLLMQDTRRSFDAAETLSRYHDLVARAKSYRLVFSDLEDAVTCLDEAFQTWPAPQVAKAARKPRPRRRPTADGAASGEVFSRSLDVSLKIVGEAGFLVHGKTNQLHQLNAMGLGLWRLLEEAAGFEAIVAVFMGAFPDIAEDQLRADLSGILSGLTGAGLIRRIYV